MKDNIDSKNIGNRKIILELRYSPRALFLDKKGSIIEDIQKSNIFLIGNVDMNYEEFTIKNSENSIIELVNVGVTKLSYISNKIDSIESFYSKFQKIFEIVKKDLGELDVLRVGCRIIGTYKLSLNNYESILEKFKSLFPKQFLLENYKPRNYEFKANYQNGMYKIGPLNINDPIFEKDFIEESSIKHVGLKIDTDNFIIKTSEDISSSSIIKDVYKLSLSVEKDIYDNINLL